MKPIEEMTDLELREAVALEVMGVHIRKQRGARKHLRDLVIPGGIDGINFVQEEGEPELTVHDLIKGVPAYESSIEAAFAVVEKMAEENYLFDAANEYTPVAPFRGWRVNFACIERAECFGHNCARPLFDNLPLAICRAALQAVRAK